MVNFIGLDVNVIDFVSVLIRIFLEPAKGKDSYSTYMIIWESPSSKIL